MGAATLNALQHIGNQLWSNVFWNLTIDGHEKIIVGASIPEYMRSLRHIANPLLPLRP